MGVNVAVVYDHATFAIFLGHEENRGCDRGFGWADSTDFEIFVEEVIEFFLFVVGEGVDTRTESCRFPAGSKFNLVIVGRVWGEFVESYVTENIGKIVEGPLFDIFEGKDLFAFKIVYGKTSGDVFFEVD